ncbi:MAG: PKD domain-containing protein [Chitinophagaceae bacterium]
MLIRKIFLCFAFCAAFLTACKKEVYDDVSFVQTAITANKLAALFTITQDNSGRVTITPNAEGGTQFEIFFGDGTTTPAKVAAGGSVQRTYKEGVYDVKIVAKNIAGQSTEAIQKLTVAFRAPENVEATIGVDPGNNFKLNVSAKALYETYFQVFFGDVANEIPTSFMEGETVTHTYTATGTYNVRVVALSGGAATTTVTKEVVIRNPVVLPLDFESATLQYNFANFDGGNSTLIDNPQKNGINTIFDRTFRPVLNFF